MLYLLTVTGPDAARRLEAMGRAGTAAVAGDARAVADAVRFWAAAGADKVVLHPGGDDGDPLDFIRFAAEQVQPLLALRGEPAARARRLAGRRLAVRGLVGRRLAVRGWPYGGWP